MRRYSCEGCGDPFEEGSGISRIEGRELDMGFFSRLVTSDPFIQLGAYCSKFGERNGPSYALKMKNGKIVYNPNNNDVEVWCQNPDDPNEFGVTSKSKTGYSVYRIRPNEEIPLNKLFERESLDQVIKDLKIIPKEVADELVKPVVKQLEAIFG